MYCGSGIPCRLSFLLGKIPTDTKANHSSPLFSYHPCKSCSDGWTLDHDNTTSRHTSRTTTSPSSIGLNFTGTGISFNLDIPDSWTTVLSINGTSYNGTKQDDLPFGTHSIVLEVTTKTNSDVTQENNAGVIFSGSTIQLGTLSGASSINATIDDSAWRDWKVLLSPGWNMLERGESNWVNSVSKAFGLVWRDK